MSFLKKLNLPNKITLLRMVLFFPLFALLLSFSIVAKNNNSYFINNQNNYQWILYSSGILFLISMFSDLLDGYLARKNNQISDFGKLFDPLADKIITTTVFIFLAVFNYAYFYLVILFIIRDLIMDGCRGFAISKNLKFAASWNGKLKTLFQTIGISILLFFTPLVDMSIWYNMLLMNFPIIIALAFALISMVQYSVFILKNIKSF